MEDEQDVTNPDIEFLAPRETQYANVYKLQKLADGMVSLVFGVDDGDTEYITSTFAVVMTEQNAASIGGSILSLLGKE